MGNATPRQRSLRLGTRGSQLARWQADWVAGELRRFGHAVELVEITTHGDADRSRPIESIGTQGVFTKAIQQALLASDVDLAVHSLKDLPTAPVPGLTLAAVPPRESTADVLVLNSGAISLGDGSAAIDSLLRTSSSQLPSGARVGTGSLRRQAQLRHIRPDLVIDEVRGNVETRLRKLDEGGFAAIILAEAGLRRLGLIARIKFVLPFNIMLPAVGQGALGIECRADDAEIIAALKPLDDPKTHAAVLAERALLEHLRGGCMAPVGALATVEAGRVRLQAVVLDVDGRKRLYASDSATISEAAQLGRHAADILIQQGAAELIASSRMQRSHHGP